MSATFDFTPATKPVSKARLALVAGPSGGKTYSALTIAAGLDAPPDRLGLIDTNNHAARKYADLFPFRWVGMSSFDPADLTRATIAAAEQGIDPLIVDTWSPFWEGPDGILDQVGKFANNSEGWRRMRPVERQMLGALLAYPGHVLVTIRTKLDYVVDRSEQGRMESRRVPTRPIQRDGPEYEFDVVLDLDDFGGICRVAKTRCPDLAGYSTSHPTAEIGERIQAWLDRNAVGELLNPITVREWALAPDRTVDELGAKYHELDSVGQLGSVVYAPNGTDLISVGDLIWRLAQDLKRNAQRATANGRQPAGAGAGAPTT